MMMLLKSTLKSTFKSTFESKSKSSSKVKVFATLSSLVLSSLAFLPAASANQTPTLPQLPGGIASLPGAIASLPGVAGALPGAASSLPGASGATGGATGSTTGGATTMGNAITLTEDQIKNLPEEQQKLVREALEKAKAAAGAAPSGGGTPTVDLGAIASQAQGVLSSLLKNLKPEQQKMLEEAQKSGKLPEGFTEMLAKGAVDPAILAKLTPEQRDALQKAIASGELSADAIKDFIGEVDVATVKDIAKSVAENKPIDVNKVKSVVTKVAKLICTNGKKKITVNTKRCPTGFKKG
jgi:hypothetical protein